MFQTFYRNATVSVLSPSATDIYDQFNGSYGTHGEGQNSMDYPGGLAMSLSGNLFVADSLNNRIVVYSSLSGNSLIDTTPINVLGQSSFNTTLPGSGELELNQPGLITYDTKYDCLWVADVNNNRIMRYSNLLSQPMAKTNSSVDVLLSFSGRTPSVALAPKGKLHFFYSYANKCINKSKCRRTPTLS